jgi:ribonuclease/clavin/mitogillin
MIEIEPYNEAVTCVKTATENDGQIIMWVYAYHIVDAIFDAGCANAASEIAVYHREKGIKRVFITHPHEDHTGSASVFDGSAKFFARPDSIDALVHPPEISEFFQFVWGQPLPVSAADVMPDEFDVGALHFQVIGLPGHFQDMVGFYEPDQRWFFSADAVPLPSRKYIAMPDENIPLMIKTMERIQAMDIDVLFDSHKGPIPSPFEHVQKRIDYLKETQDKVRDMHAEGLSYTEMMDRLGLTPPWYIEMTKDRFSVEFFLESLVRDSA